MQRVSKTKKAWETLFLRAHGRKPTSEEVARQHFDDREDEVTKEAKRKIEALLESRKAEEER